MGSEKDSWGCWGSGCSGGLGRGENICVSRRVLGDGEVGGISVSCCPITKQTVSKIKSADGGHAEVHGLIRPQLLKEECGQH